MKKSIVGILLGLMGILGMGSGALAQFESKEALFKRLHERGFKYVIEAPNRTLDTHNHFRDHVVDLETGEKNPYSQKRLEKMDYQFQPDGLVGALVNPVQARAYNISDVMVCYFIKSAIYNGYETCLIFPHPVDEVVRAIAD